MHPVSSFVTLTYSEEALPKGNTLSNEHWREFTKNLGYRYFGCGEYGDKFGRPHYHLVVFGLGALEAEAVAAERWPYGFSTARPFSVEHAAYVAAYTVKKLNRSDDSRLSAGQIPEFARMSRRPGIGTDALVPWSSWLTSDAGAVYLSRELDVPQVIKAGGAVYPLGRTLVSKLRDSCDIPADFPARTERRRAAYVRRRSDPVLVADTERKRVGRYSRMRAKALRGRGVL